MAEHKDKKIPERTEEEEEEFRQQKWKLKQLIKRLASARG
jgi:hypothetical protein